MRRKSTFSKQTRTVQCTQPCQQEKYTVGDNEVNIALVVSLCICFPKKKIFLLLFTGCLQKFNRDIMLYGYF